MHPPMWICDGVNDCDSGFDEGDCAMPCPNGFYCGEGNGMYRTCIDNDYVCDGVPDCADGLGEDNC